jgi:hypothetical protein
MKIAFYTAIYCNNYLVDIPRNFKKIKGFDYFLFTNLDEKKFCTSWQVIKTEKFHENNILSSKYVKWNSHKLLPEYDIVIWMDGWMYPNNLKIEEYTKYISDLENYNIILSKHPTRNCVYDEMNAVVKYNKDSILNVNKNKEILLKNNYPINNGLFESGFFFKNNKKEEINNILEKIYDFLVNNSYRDQLALNYIFWKYNYKNYKTMDNTIKENLHNNIILRAKYGKHR